MPGYPTPWRTWLGPTPDVGAHFQIGGGKPPVSPVYCSTPTIRLLCPSNILYFCPALIVLPVFTVGNSDELTHDHTKAVSGFDAGVKFSEDLYSHRRLHLYPQIEPLSPDLTSAFYLTLANRREVADTTPLHRPTIQVNRRSRMLQVSCPLHWSTVQGIASGRSYHRLPL